MEIDYNCEDDSLTSKFGRATRYIRQYGSDLDSKKMLFFYGRYKQVKEGPCNIPKPGMLQFEAKQKWEAWKSLGKMNKEKAMLEYISEVDTLYPNWLDTIKEKGLTDVSSFSHIGGRTVSKMHAPEKDENTSWTIFDTCKEGRMKDLVQALENGTDVNVCDEEGMSLLHWACDRGHEDIVDILLSKNCDVNLRATDGQTPLHYAVSCEYMSIVQRLLEHHADPSIKCNEGETPADVTDNQAILQLLPSCKAS